MPLALVGAWHLLAKPLIRASPLPRDRLLQRVEQLASAPKLNGAAHLTRRERQVASLIESGLSNKEIAGALSLSPATVKNHVHMILDKLNLPRRCLIMRDHLEAPPGGP